jgi:hypothetical protein
MGANAQIAVPAFTAGQILTAAQQTQINTGIPVFATTTTRDAAFGGAGEKTLAQGQYAYIEASSELQVYSGSAWIAATPTPQVAIFNEQQASNTNGGTFTSGSYVKRILNTTVINTISGCSIASSVITLPAGTYNVQAFAPAFKVDGHKVRIQNTTAATTIVLGMNAFTSGAGAFAVTHSFANTTFTLSVQSTIELQHRAESTITVNGLGTLCNFGDNEVFAQIQIIKVA